MPEAPFFTILNRIDSTNNYAMGQVHAGLAKHGMAWFAGEQTRGKGQRGKSWNAEPGQNLLLTVLLEPQSWQLSAQFLFSAAVAITCRDFICQLAGDEVCIKWPNDLYWRDRKTGGILMENNIHGSVWKCAVVGIGININQVRFDEHLPNPVSIKQITGKDHDPIQLARELHLLLLKRMEEMMAVPGSEIINRYNELLYCRNQEVKLKYGDEIIETVISSVSEKGRLMTTDERQFDFGEVSWIL